MDALDAAEGLLAAYGKGVGLKLRLENGCARLIFPNSGPVDFELDRNANCLQVYGVMGEVPVSGREGLYRALLEGNLFGTQTGGATLSIDPVKEEVLLSLRFPLSNATAEGLGELLDRFVPVIAQWRQRFSSGELVYMNSRIDSASLDAGMALLRG